MQRTQTLHVVGMHCASCVVLTEEALKESALVTNVKVDLAKHTATVSGELPENISETANLLSPLMPSGYSLTPEAIKPKVKWNEFIYALPIAVLFFIGFTALQKTGLIEIATRKCIRNCQPSFPAYAFRIFSYTRSYKTEGEME
jgi:copper chaperone CopZ